MMSFTKAHVFPSLGIHQNIDHILVLLLSESMQKLSVYRRAALWARVVRAGSERGDSRVTTEDDGGEKMKDAKAMVKVFYHKD